MQRNLTHPDPDGEIAADAARAALRRWRGLRGLTLGGLALRAGVDKATLSRWEAGKSVPRVPELQRTLDALNVPGDERERCFRAAVARVPRGFRYLAGDEAATQLPVGMGELLRALRCRAGGTQADAAGAAGVSTALVSRWERGECAPDRDSLEALSRAFQATPPEAEFLTGSAAGRVPLTLPLAPRLPKDRGALDAALRDLIAYEPTPHLDLVFFALAGRYHTLWKERKIGYAEATQIWGHFADFVCWRHGRTGDAVRLAAAALRGMDRAAGKPVAGGHWEAVLSLAWARMFAGRAGEALRVLDRYGDGVAPRHRLSLAVTRSEALCRAGAVDEGVAGYRRAIAQAPDAVRETVWRQVCAEALSRVGCYDEALSVIAPPAKEETRPSVLDGHAMTLAWALAGSGERGEAKRIYRETRPRLGDDLSPLMRDIVTPLECLLGRA